VTIGVGEYWYKPLIAANRALYCANNNYSLKFIDSADLPPPGIDINWIKISELLKVLKNESYSHFEWIFYTDLDIYIMNATIKLESILKKFASNDSIDFLIAEDGNGLNFGSFIARKSDFTIKLFESIWSLRNESSIEYFRTWHEQAVLMYLYGNSSLIRERTKILPQKMLNSYENSASRHYAYQRGDFLVHFPGDQKTQMKNFMPDLVQGQPELLNVVLEVTQGGNVPFKGR
jgi:hypothetical protein